MKKISFFAVLLCFALLACKQSAKVDGTANEGADTLAAATEQVVAQVYLVGTMSDNECQIELALQNDGFYNCAGYVLYPESEPMLVVGIWDEYFGDDGDDIYHNIQLTEYQADGTVSGRFLIHLRQADGADEFTFDDAERTYIQIDEDDQTAPIIDVTCSTEMPEWFPESPFIAATYDDISTLYAYYLRGPDAYGEVLIEKLGDGKLKFIADESREDYTAATIISEDGRPAQLDGNVFNYEKANACDYTLSARFYKSFVVLTTHQAPSEETNCSYINAAFVKR